MKIAQIITRSDAIGGATVHVRNLSLLLKENGHDVVVLLGGRGPVTDDLRKSQIPFRSLQHLDCRMRPLSIAAAIFELAKLLRQLKPDLVATHTSKAGFVGRLSATLCGIPSVHTAHGWAISDRISRFAGPWFALIERCMARFPKSIINVCKAEMELALRHRIAPSSKMEVVHLGLPDHPGRATPSHEVPTIIMVARFDREKDHKTLLSALSALADLPWKLHLVGSGPLEDDARRLVANMGISSRTSFLGYCQDVPALLRSSDIFVLTSLFEGLPISILEAMRAGLPVVASDVGGVSEAVARDVTGFICAKGSVTEVEHSIRALIQSSQLRLEMGTAGRLRYEKTFLPEEMYSKTLAIYHGALNGRPA
jgi:glycosyltransferase involved in cell wall biosynthesis